jgi:mono/diheme cytochrome c family protein
MRIERTIGLFALGLAAAVFLASGAPRAQQHSYTQQDIDAGRGLYDANCGRCHNNDGAGVPGVELFKQIKRANSDDDIAKLIQTGIPGTSMPSHQFTTPQALTVVAYLRSMVGVTPAAATTPSGRGSGLAGDAARGKSVFDTKGGCTSCHAISGTGGTTGPDLGPPPARAAGPGGGGRGGGRGAAPPTTASLERAILDPDADVAVPYRVFQVVTKSGQTVRGTLLNQDTFSVQMRDQAGDLRAFQKSDLKEHGFLPSAMPSFRGRLAPQEVADVVAYLLSIRCQR